jgi:pantoate--beta-alanine ligase
MGALHEGHRSLIKLARSLGDTVAVSIFVNPLQFGPGEDYARYPRPLEDDLQVCEAEGVDVVFRAEVTDLYPPARQIHSLMQVLSGRCWKDILDPATSTECLPSF